MNKTISKAVAAVAVVLSLGAVSQAAEAHVFWSVGVNVPIVAGPAYYPAPYGAPVYVQPAPYYVAPPVYVAPRPVYYQPAPVYYRGPRYLPVPVYSQRGYWNHGVFYRR